MLVQSPQNLTDISPARERVLDAAEQLFSQRGYASVTMRAIATQLQMKVSSLYYHAPNGKEELFVAVIMRNVQRHEQGLREALASAGSWQQQLYSAAHWLLAQPSLDMGRFAMIDQHALNSEHAEQIITGMYTALFAPLELVFAEAQARIGATTPNPFVLAGAFVALVEGFRNAPPPPSSFPLNTTQALDSVLAVLIKGLEAG
ncbi:MAG: TetR/AcrR family transcriptional regulator [Herpetosiphonaceae bacterium]|nr:TetR/AcrR family transcriptional regulator [Herpetosiphonaceae bacterium]